MKILTVVGARPQFIKAAMVSRAVLRHNETATDDRIVEEIIHTGQHYDPGMSDVFFEQLDIPRPVANLNVGSGNHARTTGEMLIGIEKEILARTPDCVLVYGDTNTTLAGALAASKLNIPLCHVEAGLRSFNRHMPEEINRIVTDRLSDLLLCPTLTAVRNLEAEDIVAGVHHVGDVMYDAALLFANMAVDRSEILSDLGVSKGNYFLATVHRAENTDADDRLRSIFEAFALIATESCPVIVPLHPRTTQRLIRLGMTDEKTGRPVAGSPDVRLIEPIPFLDMVMLEKNARTILTDSGGVQKEAYFHGVRCVTLRDETEWIETVDAGWNTIAGVETESIADAVQRTPPTSAIADYGTGQSAGRAVELLTSYCAGKC